MPSQMSRALVLAAAVAVVGATAHAQTPRVTGTARSQAPAAPGATATPKERGELARAFVQKWGTYVQRVYGVPVRTWSSRMSGTFATADAANLRNALKRDTFEGAMAALTGDGARLSDDQVIAKLAAGSAGGEKALGSLNSDLTYTPITPCRIVDTRVAGGVIAFNSERSFKGVNSANFTAQGGSATDCGTLGLSASALVLNVTAVTPTLAGFATVYPFGVARPLAASVNYTAGAIVNNSVVTPIPNPLQANDFTIYTFGQSHYVVDIVGYFAPAQATALECTETFASQNVTANATFDFEVPQCPTGYTITGAGCRTPGFNQANFAVNGLYRVAPGNMRAFCSGLNITAGTISVEGTARCCRVPGR